MTLGVSLKACMVVKDSNMKFRALCFLACLAAMSAQALAATYYLGVGINRYQQPKDQYGRPLLDENGQVYDMNLFGCVNDLEFYRDFLTRHAGVTKAKSQVLINEDATADNFLRALRKVLAQTKAGDSFYMTYSGHGAQLPSASNPKETDEYLVLHDLQLVQDKLVRDLIATLRTAGVKCTFIFDSCHSGGMSMGDNKFAKVRRRFVPRALGTRLKKSPVSKVSGPAKPKPRQAALADSLFIAASSASEASLDVTLQDGTAHGAFTLYLKEVLTKNPSLSSERAIASTRERLQANKVRQHPRCEGTPKRISRPIPG